MHYYIGIDVGTSATKAIVVSQTGDILSSASYEYPLYQPENGWAEQEPSDWANAALQALKDAVENSKADPEDIRGIGFSGQMHGLVMVDEDKKPLGRSIIWCDQRTGKQKDVISKKAGDERVLSVTGNRTNTSFTAAKILWVKENQPEFWEKCRWIMLPKDYVRLVLTGEIYTDVSDASGTQLMDVKNRCWSKEIVEALEIGMEKLPPIRESCEACGHISPEVSMITGLSVNTIVAAGAADNATAALGSRTFKEGDVFTTIGTSGVMFAHSKEYQADPKGRVHTLCAAVPGEYALMGVTQAAGLSLHWFRDEFCQDLVKEEKAGGRNSYAVLDEMASKVPIGANRLVYLPYLNGERTPCFDENCRGTFVGLTAAHGRAEEVRAIMEGVAYSLKNSEDIFHDIHVDPKVMYLCGGGSSSPFWRQMFADVFNCECRILSCTEGGSLGAAVLGACAAGDFSSVEEACEALVPSEAKTILPDPSRHKEYLRTYEVYNKIYPALKGCYEELQKV